jgi:hypothetical protein
MTGSKATRTISHVRTIEGLAESGLAHRLLQAQESLLGLLAMHALAAPTSTQAKTLEPTVLEPKHDQRTQSMVRIVVVRVGPDRTPTPGPDRESFLPLRSRRTRPRVFFAAPNGRVPGNARGGIRMISSELELARRETIGRDLSAERPFFGELVVTTTLASGRSFARSVLDLMVALLPCTNGASEPGAHLVGENRTESLFRRSEWPNGRVPGNARGGIRMISGELELARRETTGRESLTECPFLGKLVVATTLRTRRTLARSVFDLWLRFYPVLTGHPNLAHIW